MHKAYDMFLSSKVSAKSAAKFEKSERYRYKCLNCGEEVILAAVESLSVQPYFKHRKGNNNKQCEDYVKQDSDSLSVYARSGKSENEKIEFYFDNNTNMFCFGLKFSDDEISAHEQLATVFELRVAPQTRPFFSRQINSRNFISGIQTMVPLECFSPIYFSSNTLHRIERKYKVFNNTPTFFKMLGGVYGSKAKLVRSKVLYTNIPYFVVSQRDSQRYALLDGHLSEIAIIKSIEFETMNKRFLGKLITIISRTPQIVEQLSQWGYCLEESEDLMLLWPPSVFFDDIASVTEDAVYIYSTFDLQPRSNINVESLNILKVMERLTKVSIQYQVKIHEKNSELTVERRQILDNNVTLPVERKFLKTYDARDNNSFLFNHSGVSPLSKGVSVSMTPKTEVRHYKYGYLNEIIVSPEYVTPSGENLLQDVLMYYKRTESFDWGEYEFLDLSQVAFRYLEACEKWGVINAAAKRLIKEGRI